MRDIKFHQVTNILQSVDVENQSDRYLTLVGANFVPKGVTDESKDWSFAATI
jgi:hypothetical protein